MNLVEYVKELGVPCELLGLVLYFLYSETTLAVIQPKIVCFNETISAVGESEESPRGFPIVENRHGTFMLHIKNTRGLCS